MQQAKTIEAAWIAVWLGLASTGSVLAHTFLETEVDDPILPGKTCLVKETASYGSYIYHSPSKYDLVFWPWTADEWTWHCEDSGFTAFGGDFDLTDKERQAIGDYLASAYDGEADEELRLTLLEGVYGLRDKSAHFRNMLLRVLARRYQDLGHFHKANEYRSIAWQQMKNLLETDLEPRRRLEYLYISANYARQAGDTPASDQYLQALNEEIAKAREDLENQPEELEGQAEYLLEAAAETVLITPGGRLEPDRD